MSLKAFHVFFVLVSIVLAVGFGFWGARDFVEHGNRVSLALGIGSFVAGVALVVYSGWFLRKMRNVSFL